MDVDYEPQRRKNRAKRRRERQKGEDWAIEKVKEITENIERFRDAQYAAEWQRQTYEALDKELTHRPQWTAARSVLANRLDRLNGAHALRIPVQAQPLRIRPPPSIRDEHTFRAQRALHAAAEAFSKALQCEDALVRKLEHDLLPLTLFSAACFGGLAEKTAFEAFCESLRTRCYRRSGGTTGRAECAPVSTRLRISRVHQLAWLDLRCGKQTANNHLDEDGELECVRRFFPDGLTLLLMIRLARQDPAPDVTPYPGDTATMTDIRAALRRFCGARLPASMTLGRLCTGAIGVAEHQPGVQLPHYLVEYATGRIRSVSLPEPYWSAFLGSFTRSSSSVRPPADLGTVGLDVEEVQPNANVDAQIRKIRELFAGLPTQARNARKVAVLGSRIEEMLATDLPPYVGLLIGWFQDLIKDRRLAVSSTRRYSDWISRAWLIEFEGVDLGTLSAEAWFERYQALLEHVPERQRAGTAGRLMDFHTYLSTQGFPAMPGDLLQGQGSSRYIRARVIPEAMFRDFIAALQKSDREPREREALCWLFTLCFRLGTRIGETSRILLSDIEEETDRPLIMLRANRFGTTKTRAPHQIPLAPFLPEGERTAFLIWLQGRREWVEGMRLLDEERGLKPGRALVFAPEGTTSVAWDPRDLAALFTDIMYEVSGLHYTPHGCRHTTAGRLQFLAEEQAQPDGSSYSRAETESLRKAVFTAADDCPDRIWHLSSVFNHGTPETTFESYVHFSDLVLHTHLAKSERRFPPRVVKAILGSPIRLHYGERYRNKEGYLIERVLPALYRSASEQFEVVPTRLALDRPPLSPPTQTGPDSGPRRIPFDLAQRVLEKLEAGHSCLEVAADLGLERAIVEAMHRRAQRVARTLTRARKRRTLRPGQRRKMDGPLAPFPPREAEDQMLVRALIPELREVMRTEPDLLRAACAYWLEHTTMSGSGLPFHRPEDLQRVLHCFSQGKAVRPGRWLVLVRPPKDRSLEEVLKAWRVRRGVNVRVDEHRRRGAPRSKRRTRLTMNVTRYPLGVAHLHLQKRGNVRQGWQKNTSKALRYIFHMLAVFLRLPPSSEPQDAGGVLDVP